MELLDNAAAVQWEVTGRQVTDQEAPPEQRSTQSNK